MDEPADRSSSLSFVNTSVNMLSVDHGTETLLVYRLISLMSLIFNIIILRCCATLWKSLKYLYFVGVPSSEISVANE